MCIEELENFCGRKYVLYSFHNVDTYKRIFITFSPLFENQENCLYQHQKIYLGLFFTIFVFTNTRRELLRLLSLLQEKAENSVLAITCNL